MLKKYRDIEKWFTNWYEKRIETIQPVKHTNIDIKIAQNRLLEYIIYVTILYESL